MTLMLGSHLKRVAILLIATLALGWALWARYGNSPISPNLVNQVDRVDYILIEKSERRLTASRKGQQVLQYDVALGFAPIGDKSHEGDGKTPEGLFKVDRRNPNSSFHLSLGIDYPRPEDIANLLMLPGDWTAGCIALSNSEMVELWRLVDLGTVVEIRP